MTTPLERLGELGGVELWRIALDVHAATVAELQRDLSDEEQARAARLAIPAVRRRFVVARAGLRRVLARHRRVEPRSLIFAYGAHGKPALDDDPRFSLSHSGDLAVCAVAYGVELGVDVEQLRVIPEAEPIAARHLGPQAVRAIRLAGPDRDVEFLRLWTRREAFLKALGVGLAAPAPPEPDGCRWVTHGFSAEPDLVGALVVERATNRPSSPPRSPSGNAT